MYTPGETVQPFLARVANFEARAPEKNATVDGTNFHRSAHSEEH